MKMDEKSLLPSGLCDTLFPQAQIELEAGNVLLSTFKSFGYNLVNPPLMEFEETLLSGQEGVTGEDTFRVMDPSSHRMMGVRSDMTAQISRLASTKLSENERPLRLMYGGDVLRVTGSIMRPDRGFKQYGVELIGVDSAMADAEVILLSLEGLKNAGVKNISVDINIPLLPKLSAESVGIDFADVAFAFEKRDVSAMEKLGGRASEVLSAVLKCTGRAENVIKTFQDIDLNTEAKALIERVGAVVTILKSRLDADTMVTIDACEVRGFSFQTGIGFTLFCADARGELGRGGRYLLKGTGESCVGFSLYLDSLKTVLPTMAVQAKIYAPYDTDYAVIKKLRNAGTAVVCALRHDEDARISAKEKKCTGILINNNIETF